MLPQVQDLDEVVAAGGRTNAQLDVRVARSEPDVTGGNARFEIPRPTKSVPMLGSDPQSYGDEEEFAPAEVSISMRTALKYAPRPFFSGR